MGDFCLPKVMLAKNVCVDEHVSHTMTDKCITVVETLSLSFFTYAEFSELIVHDFSTRCPDCIIVRYEVEVTTNTYLHNFTLTIHGLRLHYL